MHPNTIQESIPRLGEHRVYLLTSLQYHETDKRHRANILLLLIVFFLTLWYRHCNKKAERGQYIIEGIEGFRYTL